MLTVINNFLFLFPPKCFDDCHRHDLQVGFSATDKIFLQEMSLCSLKREKREILLPLLLFVVTGIDI